ncbi:MAG TPA: hypothetical protein VK992_05800 [Candidatus Caenarcaniphilales bacterium]|nr:hypothetical protein [Candidatus Caenarcaniphilales bacterium]
MPSAAAVLRRALIGWGLGHVALGDRRGWLLLAVHLLALGALLLVGATLIEGSRWIVLLPALLLIVAAWVAQAVHAHQRALDLGAAPGGELQIALLLPLIVAGVTLFWLVGGHHASPTATLQQYVAAWRSERPAVAAALFAEPLEEAALAAAWQRHEEYVTQRVAEAAAAFGSFSGLDPRQPFNGLRFVELVEERTANSAVFAIEITRRERIETTLFGILPTATQQTVVVERIGTVRVAAHDAPPPSWLRSGNLLPSRVWFVEDVQLPVGVPLAGPDRTRFARLNAADVCTVLDNVIVML